MVNCSTLYLGSGYETCILLRRDWPLAVLMRALKSYVARLPYRWRSVRPLARASLSISTPTSTSVFSKTVSKCSHASEIGHKISVISNLFHEINVKCCRFLKWNSCGVMICRRSRGCNSNHEPFKIDNDVSDVSVMESSSNMVSWKTANRVVFVVIRTRSLPYASLRLQRVLGKLIMRNVHRESI
jgi:hypothetical protein